jgi:hypothetical protein
LTLQQGLIIITAQEKMWAIPDRIRVEIMIMQIHAVSSQMPHHARGSLLPLHRKKDHQHHGKNSAG